MEQFQQGKHAAFEELYRRYSPRLLHFIYRMLDHREAESQDVLQDVFMMLAEQPFRFDTSRDFKPWIFTVTANACRKQFRIPQHRDSEEHLSELPLHDDKIEALLDQKAFKRVLKKELTMLKYDHRCTFILRYQERLSIREVAQIMECSEGTVKSRIHYTIKHLAKRLSAFHPTNQ